MIDIVDFTINGEPKPKGRPRYTKVKDKVITYTPKNTASFENYVKLVASKYFTRPLEGPVSLKVVFFVKRPKRLIWKKKRIQITGYFRS